MEKLPPGFRFHPTDEELVAYYLTNKVADCAFIARVINVVDLNKYEPWQLPDKTRIGEKDWYFFSKRDRKYPTGMRANRSTDAGYWKTTGKDKEIISSSGTVIGMKKTLVFYKGRAPKGEKTNWVIHEYRLTSKFPARPYKEEWVVCRVFHKKDTAKRIAEFPTASTLLLAKREIEPFSKDYQTEPNLDFFELSRITEYGSDEYDHVPQISRNNGTINSNIGGTTVTHNCSGEPSPIPSNHHMCDLSLPSSLYSSVYHSNQQQPMEARISVYPNAPFQSEPSTVLSASQFGLDCFWRGS